MAQAQQGAVRPGNRPSVRARLAGATAALAVLMTLGACSPAASPEPAPTTTASSPSPTPSPEPTLGETAEPSPEPSPSPTDPNDRSELLVEPEEMENVDEEGAVAAAKYFMGLFEYAYLTGDLDKWEEMSLEGCGFCSNVADAVKKTHRDNHYMVSGAPKWIGKAKVSPVAGGPRWEVRLRAEVSASKVVDQDAKVINEYPKARQKVVLVMEHDATSWRVLSVDIESDG